MQCIKSKTDLIGVNNPAMAASIANAISEMEQQYQDIYDATQYGWFVICEQEKDLIQLLPQLPFSVLEKVNNEEAEYIERLIDWYEVLIMLNDTEGVLVYVPIDLWPLHLLPQISTSPSTFN